MLKGNVLAIDLAKSSFQVHLATAQGRVLKRQKLSRGKVLDFVAKSDANIVAMEACGSSNYWARRCIELGKEVRLIAPQFVKPFVKSNKNDANDAEGIAEAASRANMRFVPVKTIAQQDMIALHRIRSRLVANRTALSNQIRGLLAEYGIVTAKGHAKLRELLVTLCDLNSPAGDLSEFMREEMKSLRDEFSELSQKIADFDRKLEQLAKKDDSSNRLMKITGIGPKTATALIATAGNMKHFKNGRQFAAFLGLVPRQNSTGGKQKLLGISKRGDTYLRTLLIHGARASLISAHKRTDYRSTWSLKLWETKGINRAAVALANRNARTAFALIKHGRSFDSNRPATKAV